MKKLLLRSLILVLALFLFTSAQRTMPIKSWKQGDYKTFGGGTMDTIVSNDTVTYIFIIDHTSKVYPYFTIYLTRSSVADTTVRLYYQSNIGSQTANAADFIPIKKGINQTPLSDTLHTNTYYDISFSRDTAVLEGRCLKLMFVSNTKSTFRVSSIRGQVKILL